MRRLFTQSTSPEVCYTTSRSSTRPCQLPSNGAISEHLFYQTMRLLHILITMALIGYSTAQEPAPTRDAKPQVSLESLKERSKYAVLDKNAVEKLARLAEDCWKKEFSRFSYQRTERFSAGGASHWMSIWLHGRTGLEFVLVPGGRFQMGAPANEANRREDELQHWVTLDPFLIARTECTQSAWAKFASTSGLKGDSFKWSDQHPVSGINPVDVENWCREAHLTFTTEAQWEFMCRAGTKSAWTVGANKTDLGRFGNLGSAECPEDWIGIPGITEPWLDGFGDHAAPVGTFAANAFGLFDVHGNLGEWCRDYYLGYEVPVEKGTGKRIGISKDRMARGGNFGTDASVARSAFRHKLGSGISPGGNKGFGFRPSLDLSFEH